jgi:DNA-binding transcriptional ArsR family regulator
VHPFEVLAEPVRRRIVEILASGEHSAGTLEEVVTHEFGVGRSAVQHRLRLLHRCGWTIVREEWPNRWHRLDDGIVPKLEREVRHLRVLWNRRIGTYGGVDPGAPFAPLHSRKGRRGRRADPDDPWVRSSRYRR